MKNKIFTISFMLLGLIIGQIAPAFNYKPLITGANVANAADPNAVAETGKELICKNGSRDWITFLSAVISYDDFVEYWRDIIGMPPAFINSRYSANYCLFLDVDNLLRQIKKAREQVRKAFYACDPNAESFKKNYYRLEVELFFLRKYVDVTSGQLIPLNENKLYNDLQEYFVIDKSFFSKEEIKVLYDKLLLKYKPRIDTYGNCSDPGWEDLILKLKELRDNVKSGFGIKDAAENIKKSFNKVINAPLKRTGNFLGGLMDAKINGIDPKLALSDLMGEINKNLPDGYTFDQLNKANLEDVSRYDNAVSKATYLAQYEGLYKNSSADIFTNIMGQLTTLEGIVTGTFNYINQTTQCTKGLLDKAC